MTQEPDDGKPSSLTKRRVEGVRHTVESLLCQKLYQTLVANYHGHVEVLVRIKNGHAHLIEVSSKQQHQMSGHE